MYSLHAGGAPLLPTFFLSLLLCFRFLSLSFFLSCSHTPNCGGGSDEVTHPQPAGFDLGLGLKSTSHTHSTAAAAATSRPLQAPGPAAAAAPFC